MSLLSRSDWFKTVGGTFAGMITFNMAMQAGGGPAPEKKEAGEGGVMKYELPPLPYPYDALEPHIDKETLTIHHDKHHNTYDTNLNNVLVALEAARKANDFAAIQSLCHKLAFNGSGHMLHTLYWFNLTPQKTKPDAGLTKAINASFGSFEAMQNELHNAALTADGSGWGALVYEPMAARLFTVQIEKHQDQFFMHTIPILIIDVWEHAYYLKYQNRRVDYLKAIQNVINWAEVSRRYGLIDKATQSIKAAMEKK
jgi:Fe-Mn family superoxide dismutase